MVTFSKNVLEDLKEISCDTNSFLEVNENEITRAKIMQFAGSKRLYETCVLASSKLYQSIMDRVNKDLNTATKKNLETSKTISPLDESAYTLLLECNELVADIDNEINFFDNLNRDQYRPRFPELGSLLHNPIDFARVIQAIGNEADITQVELDGVLPSSSIMVVIVTASTTVGRPLPEAQMKNLLEGCEMTLRLDADKSKLLCYVEKKMNIIAPNLSMILGPLVGAKLMGLTGGLRNLSKVPACNIQVLGAKQKTLIGFSSSNMQSHRGLIFGSEIIQQTPPGYRDRALKLVSSKCALLVRIDASGQDPVGDTGRSFREKITEKIKQWQELRQTKAIQPLPIPDGARKKKRGGRRARKYKERYGLTEVNKAVCRVGFNQQQEELLEGDEPVGLGMLENHQNRRFSTRIDVQKIKLSKIRQKKTQNFASIKNLPGTSSSLVFTPLQGIELSNPIARKSKAIDGTKSYVSEFSKFKSKNNP